ncbi:hypothetical protein [Streptomyces johnsoniae]|uniref:Uncharacterized protein n=1 Tax=Streptomyces johnsoniae TaxID=3075532 RepID=A0ABU2S063_9ACTN|nr:hypothetical protein [Streptomyces sp. DSM 41886]MDT0442330.1 hypothetical protein [Streptomyces sp. DSM 41886]
MSAEDFTDRLVRLSRDAEASARDTLVEQVLWGLAGGEMPTQDTLHRAESMVNAFARELAEKIRTEAGARRDLSDYDHAKYHDGMDSAADLIDPEVKDE